MASDDDDRESLGPWTGANLSKTAQADAGIGADDGLADEIRFVRNIASLVRRRRATTGANDDPNVPAVFLLQPIPPEEVGGSAKRVPMLDNGLTAVTGRIWFVGAGPASGHYIDTNLTEDDALFSLITETLGHAATPAIIFDPRLSVPEVRYYSKGLGYLDSYVAVKVSDVDIAIEDVLTVVDAVYKSCLVTPEVMTDQSLWHNKDKFWPSKNAEAMVQGKLHAGLAGAFPTCTVRPEQTMAEGRLDLQIERSEPLDRSKVTVHAILELKVLRSFGETGRVVSKKSTLNWIEGGVKQAAAYRNGKGARWSALFCFDMRKENSGAKCFDHVKELAANLDVLLRTWFLYTRSSHYREAQTSTA
jgi:hypothetical protein